ncbi:MAG: RING finger domain-containing protein [Chlamydiota bacterium]
MSVSFSRATVYNPKDLCVICHDTLEGSEVIAHNGPNGAKHPMHKACMREWLKVRPSCPFCQERVNIRSFFSWKERAIIIIKAATLPALAIGSIILMETEGGIDLVTGSRQGVIKGILGAAIGGLAGISIGSFDGIGKGVMQGVGGGLLGGCLIKGFAEKFEKEGLILAGGRGAELVGGFIGGTLGGIVGGIIRIVGGIGI